jgi:signal transduction histidine kinase
VINASQSCVESVRSDARITLRIERRGPHVAIAVADNGVGIAPDNLGQIFGHGFTTKKDGHGFGLHSAALAAKELGGELTAASAGAGCGATFTLVLPVEAEAKQAAA